MKKILMMVVVSGICLNLFAQNVGIGTNIPAAKLDVKSTSNYIAQFNGAGPMYIGLYESDVYRGYFGSYSGAAEDIDYGTGVGNTTGKLHFTIQAVPKMTINSVGQVGIGTMAPLSLLHLNGGDLLLQSGSIRFGTGGPNEWQLLLPAGSADLRMASSSAGPNAFVVKHYFSQNGNVGIGSFSTVIPISRLDVIGAGTNSSTNTFTLRNSNGDTMLRMRDDGRMGIGYNGTTYGRQVNIGGAGINFYTANEIAFGGAVFPTDTSLVLWSNSNANNYLVLQPSWGNTGIGTYTPNAKLHVNGVVLVGSNSSRTATGYSVSVAGKIMCTDLTMMPTSSWPDYVFEKNYKLMPLDLLESSIEKNRHLPNMPSAAEIEKNGIQMNEISRKLMEKIEELTLYIIGLNKKVIDLTKKNTALEDRFGRPDLRTR